MMVSMKCNCGGIKKYFKYFKNTYPAKKVWKCVQCGKVGEHFYIEPQYQLDRVMKDKKPEMFETMNDALLSLCNYE